jgi:hypothetical protein
MTPSVDSKVTSSLISSEIKDAARTICDTAKVTGDQLTPVINSLSVLYQKDAIASLAPILPMLLKLKGQPYTLTNYKPMEPLFTARPPRTTVIKSGRQLSKSTTLAALAIIRSLVTPHFSTLYIAPRMSQTQRFSTNYIRPFLTGSGLSGVYLATDAEQSVFQRNFNNGAILHFSYAFHDAERIRGISADCVEYDETQDIDPDFVPVINETLSASPYSMIQYAGTPKTLDNLLEALWEESSQAEWCIRCGCGQWNIASVDFELIGMIQPKGLCCVRCGHVIDADNGHWEHRFPERRTSSAGYHLPQVIFPMHYKPDPKTHSMEKWDMLVKAKDTLSKAVFYNEKLGEACDVRANLLTRHDLRRASCLPHENDLRAALKLLPNYTAITLGIDWGGGGESGLSSTKVAVLGRKHDDKLDVIYGENLVAYNDHIKEAQYILHLAQAFHAQLIGHDFGGAGVLRETLLIQAGFPANQIFPANYNYITASAMVTYKAPTGDSTRHYYVVDKTRSLLLLCQLVKYQLIRFPRFESWESLADDFLALVEDTRTALRGPDLYVITRKASQSDDFVHAVNFAALAHWHALQRYPDLASYLGIRLSPSQLSDIVPASPL